MGTFTRDYAAQSAKERAEFSRVEPELMGDVVNLRLERKRKRRVESAEKATEQRVLHGTSKSERSLKEAREKLEELNRDQHRLDTGDRE